jgi:hypothetical protein
VNYFWQGPEKIDLFNSTETLGNIGITPGVYKRMEFEVIANKSDAGNDPVLYLSGTYTNSNGAPFPIIIEIRDDLKLISQKNNVTIKRDLSNGYAGVINVYLNKIFGGILPGNLDEITENDGTIMISPDSNRYLYDIIVSNLNKGRGTKIEDPATDDLNSNKQ